jgi:hypothetical protein
MVTFRKRFRRKVHNTIAVAGIVAISCRLKASNPKQLGSILQHPSIQAAFWGTAIGLPHYQQRNLGEMMLSLIWNRRQEEQEQITLCSDPLHIPLASAYLCQDCNCVGNCSTQCPACASTVLMNLSSVLNREVETVVQELEQDLEYEYVPARRLSAFEEVAA